MIITIQTRLGPCSLALPEPKDAINEHVQMSRKSRSGKHPDENVRKNVGGARMVFSLKATLSR